MEYTNYYSTSPSSTQSHQQSRVLSCAECRRSKLRCDRQFPCETCRKRGLEHLCPDGALITRPKSLAADAEYLRQENLRLRERVRQLEGALVLLAGFSPEGQSQTDAVLRSLQSSQYGHGYGPTA
ncbi:hypothetical protein K439DRAFT_416484 [Ramaria rubella]|nr:hypothetical protein K439DRAFT_416484 [Ramaria rubella]